MWVLWWTKRHWGRFSPSTSVSPATYSTDFSIIIITRGWHNRPLSGRNVQWTFIPPPTMQIKKSNDLIRILNRNLLACSIVPQPTALPRAITSCNMLKINWFLGGISSEGRNLKNILMRKYWKSAIPSITKYLERRVGRVLGKQEYIIIRRQFINTVLFVPWRWWQHIVP
jgi:hypothetical protein